MPKLILTTPQSVTFMADGATLLQCAAHIERKAAARFPTPLSECDDFRMALDHLRHNPNRLPVRRYECERFRLHYQDAQSPS